MTDRLPALQFTIHAMTTRPTRTKRRYKPVKSGDPYDPRSVEGHINVVRDAAETRRFNRMVKEREAEREAMKPMYMKLWDLVRKMLNA